MKCRKKALLRAWAVRKSALGTIYAIATAAGANVKIGFTIDLPRRRAILARDRGYYGVPGEVVASAIGTFSDELRLHAQLYKQSYRATKGFGPRELYPMSVLTHPAAVAIFGSISIPKRARAA